MPEDGGSPLKAVKGNRKVLLYVGGAGAAYVVYRYWKAQSNASAAAAAAAVPMDTSVAQGGGGASMPNTNVGNSTLNTPVTNADWTNTAVQLLTAQGWDGPTVTTALGKYLNHAALTDAEVIIVQAALAVAGNPPVGSFGLVRVSNPNPPPTNTPKVPTKAPGGFTNFSVDRTSAVTHWGAVPDATGYEVYFDWLRNSSRTSVPSAEFRGLKPNTRYTYKVRGYNSAGPGPWSSTQYFVTKK